MFKVSTKGDYGLLFLSGLAEAHRAGKDFVSMKEVAGEKHLSLPYLSQIVMPLKKAGLIESREGRVGGYRLARAPKEITMLEVLEVLEGPVEPVKCCCSPSSGLVGPERGRHKKGGRIPAEGRVSSWGSRSESFPQNKGKCGSESYCNVQFSWKDAKALLIQFLRTRTLEDTINSSPLSCLPAGRARG